ncbi:MAG: DHHA1 domain-containing protein [Salinirussus sp.]
MGPVPALEDSARICADRLHAAEGILLASHIDADGLTSAAIASRALERAGQSVDIVFEDQLDEAAIERLAAADHQTVLFTDFGSGQLEMIADHADAGDFDPVVVDHHQPADVSIDAHLNPLLEGIDGASELSGAGTAYILARALETDHDNRDLAALAIVGAVGDMQAVGGELVGANREIVAEGVAADVLAQGPDLAFYGTQTRPLPKLLEYGSEVSIPGITNNEAGATAFLRELDLDLTGTGDGDWRRWVDLGDDERQRLASALVQRAIQRGVPAEEVEDLVATTYTLPAEPAGTELRDASEFSTLLNATARYDRADVGLAVCLGDRDGALERARRLLRNHRRNLSEGLEWVQEHGVTSLQHLQYFDAGAAIRETIVGIVAGMALGTDGVDGRRPIIAFARKSDAETKVSARGTGRLVGRGLDLSAVMSEAAGAVGGEGGGHNIAAGATIPTDTKEAFIEHADQLVGAQLNR